MDDLWFLVWRYLFMEVDPATGKPMYPGKIARRKMGVSLIAISGSNFLAAIINQEKVPILYMMRKPIIITYSSLTVV